MVVKITGIVLVMFSSVLVGRHFANRDSLHISVLNELLKALAILKAEIEFALTPLPEALKNISQRINGQVGEIFYETGQRLSEREGRVAKIWEDALKKYSVQAHLDGEDLEQLTSFGKTLGYLDRSMQLSSIGLLEDYLTRRVIALTELHSKNKKMFNSLGVLFGLLVVIVFI